MDERRIAPRHRVLKAGSIVINRSGTLDCRILNVSATGACLDVASQVGIADEFTLIEKPSDFRRLCRVAWRTVHRLGVRFATANEASTTDRAAA